MKPAKWHVREDGGQLEIVSRSPRTTRIAIVCADGDATQEDRQTAERIAAVPKLEAIVRELAGWECSQAVHPKTRCGDCLVCIAQALVEDLP